MRKSRFKLIILFNLYILMNNWIFEVIGVVAGICIAIPSIPQIWQTLKSKNVSGLSPMLFGLLAMGTGCYFIYGRHLGSISMMIFNAISVISAIIMLILIYKYRKK